MSSQELGRLSQCIEWDYFSARNVLPRSGLLEQAIRADAFRRGSMATLAGNQMFGWLTRRREMRERAEFKNLFGKYIRPELVEALDSPGFSPRLNELRDERINFILVAVTGPTPNEIGKNLGIVSEISREAGWYADCVYSNLAVLTDGVLPPVVPARSSSVDVRAKLREALGNLCKTLSGEQVTAWGDYGSPRQRVFSAMFPDFLEMVSELHAQPYGSYAEKAAR